MMDECRGGQVAEVLSALEESSILEKGMLEKLASAILAEGALTREEATSYLVREGHLSSFQGEQVTGNRVLGASLGGIQLALLGAEAGDILIANNTTLECTAAFRLWDGDVLGKRIELSGNLFLAGGSRPDMVFIDSGGTVLEARGPGDGRLLHERWSLGKNWREVRVPEGEDLMAKSWVPAAPSDVLRERMEVLSREATSPDFLRPPAGSPLATGGLGDEDSAFPPYAGAVPPPDVEPWDWGKTWEARHPRKLITVSKETAAGGDCRTISEALEKARPGVTIRVLDDATYRETIFLRRRDIHSGITLEAPRGATLEPEGRFLIVIIDIPNFTVRGFRLLLKGAPSGVTVHGRCPGVLLDNLDITASSDSSGISLDLLDIPENEAPVVVRAVTVRGAARALRLSGIQDDYKTAAPCGRVAVHGNLFTDSAIGIVVAGSLHEVILAGNRISGSSYAGIQLENLLEGASKILIANNSLAACRHAIRLWDDRPSGTGIEIRGNVALGSWAPDMVFIDSGDSPQSIRGPGDGAALLAIWGWSRNWREGVVPAGESTDEKSWIPAAPSDVLRERIDGVLRDPKARGYLQPLAGSPLATGGAGQDDPSLPPYAGAVPPEGMKPWDWAKTWEAWSARWAKK